MFSKKRIFELTKKIPVGRVTTYKHLAIAAGNPKAARAVGAILRSNKNLIKIPCHRVVCSNGYVGGYKEGVEKKIALLKKEGVIIKNKYIDKKFLIKL